MPRKLMLLTSAALLIALVGCHHKCHKQSDCCGSGVGPIPPGVRGPINLPPPGVPTTPSVLPPGSSGYIPPGGYLPPSSVPAPRTGPEVLLPDPIPGSSSARPVTPKGSGVLGAPVRPVTAEPPKAPAATGLAGYTKVKDGLYAGAKPTLDGFDSLKAAGFRSVVYLHAPGADVAAVKDMASTRDLNFIGIETTPENLADRLNRPAYVFADEPTRAGAVWYLHFRTAEALGDDVARLRAKPLGLSEQGEEGKAFALAIQKVLASR
jgi:hypothetical protein